jgi:hypothetical protein
VHGRLNSGQASILIDYIQSACQEAWAFFDWPEIHRIEARTPLGGGFVEGSYTFESDYADTVAYIGRAVHGAMPDQAVWRIKRITTTDDGEAVNIDTAVNVRWDNRVDAVYNEDSTNQPADMLLPYIYLAEPGMTPIGDVAAVWNADPAKLARKLKFSVSDDKLLITDTSYVSGQVFVEFDVPMPEFAMSEYTTEEPYNARVVVYHTPTGDCYKALVQNKGDSPASQTSWLRQSIPFFLGNFLKERVLGDLYLAADKDQKAIYQFARAESLLLRAMDDAWLRKGEVRNYSARLQ